jgi:adenine-specific DNA-methyltransferase
LDDFPVYELTNLWSDIAGIMSRSDPKIYVVQTSTIAIQRCLLMTTDPGDLVFDPTCGSGTTAYVAEQWGRRWITCDTSRVAIALAKQRLATSLFNHFELAHYNEGISSGFKYKIVPHVTLGSLANDEPAAREILYDQPIIDNTKVRICGPFTVEAVPSPMVKSSMDDELIVTQIDTSISHSGETLRQDLWRNELQKTGIRGKGGQKIEFSRVEVFSGTQWLHADAETKHDQKRAVISFGPEYAPLEQRQVARAIEEAQKLVPKPQIIVFAAFQFDPEAAKDIDETNWPGVTLLKVQMNADLLTEDLKKKRSSNESFWLMGQPDADLKKQKDGKYVVELRGFDYYNPITGEIESGDSTKVAMWELDIDYDGRSLYPSQVFFPMSGTSDGWSKLAKTLRAEIDDEKIEQYRGTISLPFDLGINKRIAVKIIDDRGIESLRIIRVK